MTQLERTATITEATDRAEPDRRRRRSMALAPAEASLSTEELLRRRDRLPVPHPDRARLRARAIEQNLPMAARLARRYAGRGELLDDLTQVAALGLINAVDHYDPDRQVPFAGYAIPSILGALKRHFRDVACAIRAPRPTQELALRLPAATNELGQRLGRTPTNAQLADHLQVTAGAIMAANVALQNYRPQSLNTPAHASDDGELIDAIGGLDQRYAGVEDRLSLRPLLAGLPLRERRILTMRYHDQMNQAEIAAAVGLSQMHVSRLLRLSLAQLRLATSGWTSVPHPPDRPDRAAAGPTAPQPPTDEGRPVRSSGPSALRPVEGASTMEIAHCPRKEGEP